MNVTCRNMHSKSLLIPSTVQAHIRITSFRNGGSKDRFFGQFWCQVRLEGVKQVEIVHTVTSWKCCDCLALCFGLLCTQLKPITRFTPVFITCIQAAFCLFFNRLIIVINTKPSVRHKYQSILKMNSNYLKTISVV